MQFEEWDWVKLKMLGIELLLKDEQLTNFDVRLFFVIVNHLQYPTSVAFVSQSQLAKYMHCQRQQITRAMKRLLDLEYVTKIGNGKYRVHQDLATRNAKKSRGKESKVWTGPKQEEIPASNTSLTNLAQ